MHSSVCFFLNSGSFTEIKCPSYPWSPTSFNPLSSFMKFANLNVGSPGLTPFLPKPTSTSTNTSNSIPSFKACLFKSMIFFSESTQTLTKECLFRLTNLLI